MVYKYRDSARISDKKRMHVVTYTYLTYSVYVMYVRMYVWNNSNYKSSPDLISLSKVIDM